MKRIFYIILTVAIVLSLSSCALHYGLTANLNNSTTNVVLQTNNYKIIKKVEGTATGTRILCLFGGFQRPLVEKARNEMLKSANLIGKSRAVINETIEENNKFFLLVGFKTVTVSAYVIEFTDSGVVSKDDDEDDDEDVIKIINGKWMREDDRLEITFDADGSVGVFSQINAGQWLRLLKNGTIKNGDPVFKDITKIGRLAWGCMEFIDGKEWFYTRLIMNEEGNKLSVNSYWGIYTLTKVE